MSNIGTIHIYGQDSWHDEAYLVGDKSALLKLREAIDKALESGFGVAHVTVADGEGYSIHVVQHETERMEKLTLPYQRFVNYTEMKNAGRYPSSLVPWDKWDEVLGDAEWFEAQRKLGFDYEK